MEMETRLAITFLYFSSLCFHLSYSSPSRLRTIGIHPLDDKYYDGELIKCKDGSKSFSRYRLNDNFCDCPDGTDEPGTSACPAGKFYCRNSGSTPRFLFSSHVNDNICDCCDGSDEYAGKVMCPNTCIMGGNIVYQTVNHDMGASNLGSFNSRKTNPMTHMKDSAQKLGGLKVLVFLQLALAIAIVAFRVSCKRKARRRNAR